ncbi:MAG: hypothetical protein RL385_1454, partial [Pseudomonadota bacterium]
VRCGWHGDLESVPAGFATELAVIAGDNVRSCIDTWGALLRRRAGTVRPGRWPDALGSMPSYWTDNGAAYWYRTEPGHDPAAFADPVSGFPFRTKGGVLRIEARKDSAVNLSRPWRSGLLSSNDPKGHGFSLQYGYFEISAKLPGAKGVWPAFWLSTSSDRTDPNSAADGLIEIDVLEFYGFAEAYFAALHVWKPEPRHDGKIVNLPNRDASKGFHTYGALVTPEWIRFYRDRRETWRTRTPSEHKRPLMILLNLALGGGWPIDGVPNPSYMLVDYVRAYAKP